MSIVQINALILNRQTHLHVDSNAKYAIKLFSLSLSSYDQHFKTVLASGDFRAPHPVTWPATLIVIKQRTIIVIVVARPVKSNLADFAQLDHRARLTTPSPEPPLISFSFCCIKSGTGMQKLVPFWFHENSTESGEDC